MGQVQFMCNPPRSAKTIHSTGFHSPRATTLRRKIVIHRILRRCLRIALHRLEAIITQTFIPANSLTHWLLDVRNGMIEKNFDNTGTMPQIQNQLQIWKSMWLHYTAFHAPASSRVGSPVRNERLDEKVSVGLRLYSGLPKTCQGWSIGSVLTSCRTPHHVSDPRPQSPPV
jgi:hypothetical protein